MNHPFATKSIFLWQTSTVQNGNPAGIADLLQGAGFEMVILKVADGPYQYRPGGRDNVSPALVQELKHRGIGVTGYGFLYGKNPIGEADAAITQTLTLGLDGYVFDVEGAFDTQTDAESDALTILTRYKQRCPSIPTAYCAWALWRNPTTGSAWHPERVARAFMRFCDVGMPMIYWGGDTPANALWWLNNSLKQWRTLTDRPIIPAGRAYVGDGGKARADAMDMFEMSVRNAGCPGISWWSMQHALKLDGIWAELAEHTGFRPGDAPSGSAPGVGLPEWAAALDKWAREQGYTGPALEV